MNSKSLHDNKCCVIPNVKGYSPTGLEPSYHKLKVRTSIPYFFFFIIEGGGVVAKQITGKHKRQQTDRYTNKMAKRMTDKQNADKQNDR